MRRCDKRYLGFKNLVRDLKELSHARYNERTNGRHPNVVSLYDVVENRESICMVMEMLPMDFFDAINGKPRFTEEKW